MPLLVPTGAGSFLGRLSVTLGHPVLQELSAFGKRLTFRSQIDLTVTKFLQMCEYGRVLNRVLVPVQVALLHMIGNGVFQPVALLSFFPADGHVDHPLDVVPVETVLGVILGIRQGLWSLLQYLLGGNRERRIHVQLEIGHDKQLIPQLVLKIGDVPEVGLQVAHDTDDGLGHFVALLTVFNTNRIVDHFLEMPAVFGYEEMGTFCVVFDMRC